MLYNFMRHFAPGHNARPVQPGIHGWGNWFLSVENAPLAVRDPEVDPEEGLPIRNFQICQDLWAGLFLDEDRHVLDVAEELLRDPAHGLTDGTIECF